MSKEPKTYFGVEFPWFFKPNSSGSPHLDKSIERVEAPVKPHKDSYCKEFLWKESAYEIFTVSALKKILNDLPEEELFFEMDSAEYGDSDCEYCSRSDYERYFQIYRKTYNTEEVYEKTLKKKKEYDKLVKEASIWYQKYQVLKNEDFAKKKYENMKIEMAKLKARFEPDVDQ